MVRKHIFSLTIDIGIFFIFLGIFELSNFLSEKHDFKFIVKIISKDLLEIHYCAEDAIFLDFMWEFCENRIGPSIPK